MPAPPPPAARHGGRSRGEGGKSLSGSCPTTLQPDSLPTELIDLGAAFRADQQRAEPDLALLAWLHERKARAFALWAGASGDAPLRLRDGRAEAAARTTGGCTGTGPARPSPTLMMTVMSATGRWWSGC
ncbi:hypothetical protein ABZX40_14930 [Streptomyces sp. NPDC004610]|uniref:hypothetical protein n=1 Tax=unclassified Streptomyces TaxID=2593676 RepID=UPI0033BF2A3C